MRTYCLVIDDNNQKSYFETSIREVLQKNNIELVPIFINPKDNKYMKQNHSGFDKILVERDCLQAIREHNFSIVLSDYQIATTGDDFNGLDILNSISEHYPQLYKILYSGGNIKKAINQALATFKDAIEKEQLDDNQTNDTIDKLKKLSCINEFVKGKGYANAVINYMRTSPLILQQTLLGCLKDNYPDMVFQSCYTIFKGKKFKEIGDEIEKRTILGCDFQQAIIEQAIAYLTNINIDGNE